MKRRSKTLEQQCKHYNCENFFEYMIEKYKESSFPPYTLCSLYNELNLKTRQRFISYCLTEIDNRTKLNDIIFIVCCQNKNQ